VYNLKKEKKLVSKFKNILQS